MKISLNGSQFIDAVVLIDCKSPNDIPFKLKIYTRIYIYVIDVAILSIVSGGTDSSRPSSLVIVGNPDSGKEKDGVDKSHKDKMVDDSGDSEGFGNLSSPSSAEFEQWVKKYTDSRLWEGAQDFYGCKETIQQQEGFEWLLMRSTQWRR